MSPHQTLAKKFSNRLENNNKHFSSRGFKRQSSTLLPSVALHSLPFRGECHRLREEPSAVLSRPPLAQHWRFSLSRSLSLARSLLRSLSLLPSLSLALGFLFCVCLSLIYLSVFINAHLIISLFSSFYSSLYKTQPSLSLGLFSLSLSAYPLS